jgi:hypothetical protein
MQFRVSTGGHPEDLKHCPKVTDENPTFAEALSWKGGVAVTSI